MNDGMKTHNWIFLRGLTRGNIHWGSFPEIFQQHYPNDRVELLEIPGNGTQFDKSSLSNPAETIEFIRSQSQFCHNNEKFNLCGISLGGMIAMKWAELYPEEVISVAVINTSLKQFSPFYHRLRPSSYMSLLKALFSLETVTQETTVLKVTSNNFSVTSCQIGKFAEFTKTHPVSKVNFIKQLLLANNIKINQPFNIPFKVIFSEQDRLVSSQCSKKIAQQFNAKTFIHPTTGHDLPLDDPQWLAQTLGKTSTSV